MKETKLVINGSVVVIKGEIESIDVQGNETNDIELKSAAKAFVDKIESIPVTWAPSIDGFYRRLKTAVENRNE